MKTIGLIGGSTYVSTTEYYKTINQLTQKKLGGSYSASILMYSMKFQEFKGLVQSGSFDEVAKYLSNIAINLEKGGAQCLVIGANTPHMYAEAIQQTIKIPIIHIADATAKAIEQKGLKKIALLGTKPTMEQDFYKKKLAAYGIETVIPNEEEREYLNETIFNEFSREIFTPEAKRKYLDIIQRLKSEGAQGVILGCTEIPILIKQEDCDIPVFDTMFIHSEAAVEFANKQA
jgi:aspartate racemase